jgi:LruC domain-containing protein
MLIKPLWLAALSAATLTLSGYTFFNSRVDWTYFGTSLGAHAYDLSTGAPKIAEFTTNLPPELPAFPTDLLEKIAYSLPEGRDIRLNSQGLIPDTDDKSNVIFSEEADVWVTFLSEGAGYRNSIGYFKYDPLHPPQYPRDVSEKIIFANASMPSPLDPAGAKQNTIYLGKFLPGQALGFMIVSNGFSNTGRLYDGNRIAGVKDNPDPKWVFYSLRQLNPEVSSSANLNVHTVMLKDLSGASDGYQRLVMGFEDINRSVGGDHDFNDVVLAVHVNKRSAIANLTTLQPLVAATDLDSDGDGVKDALDEFPNDATRAFSRYYPTRNTFGTLAFEDLWPTRGDYDMNDMVIRYRSREILNSSRQTVALEVDYRLDARGASIESGFGVQLPTVGTLKVASASLTTDSGTQTLNPEEGQDLATFLVFNSARVHLPGPSAACSFGNTQAECPGVPFRSFKLAVNLTHPSDGNALIAPYNPFIFRTSNRGHEVHLSGRPPTKLADTSLFGTADDRSQGVAGKTYVDQNGRPWALDIPIEWRYPNETVDLTLAYPDMAAWATSAGSLFNNWYITALNPTWLFVNR